LIARKQIDILIEAFSMITPNLPDTASLVILGDGEERARLEKMAASFGISNRVLFTGAVLDTQKYLQTSDIFVIPSSIEVMPIILLEAMSCGLPCIASKIGGIEDLIEDEQTGLFIVSGDVVDLKEKLEMVLNDNLLSMKLGQAARGEIVKRSSMKATAQSHLNLYKKLLG
jgi:1,4-alpha-glucan branching enzyme